MPGPAAATSPPAGESLSRRAPRRPFPKGPAMTLTDRLTEYVHAAFTGLWVQTHEADEAEREILQHARQAKWTVAVWDVADGLRVATASAGTRQETGAGDPLAALRALPALADSEGTALLLMHNLHRFLTNP